MSYSLIPSHQFGTTIGGDFLDHVAPPPSIFKVQMEPRIPVYSKTRDGGSKLVLGPNTTTTLAAPVAKASAPVVELPSPACMLLESRDPTPASKAHLDALETERLRLDVQVSTTCSELVNKFTALSAACQQSSIAAAETASAYSTVLRQASAFAELTCSTVATDANDLVNHVQSIHRRMEQGQALIREIRKANDQVTQLEAVLTRMELARGIPTSPQQPQQRR